MISCKVPSICALALLSCTSSAGGGALHSFGADASSDDGGHGGPGGTPSAGGTTPTVGSLSTAGATASGGMGGQSAGQTGLESGGNSASGGSGGASMMPPAPDSTGVVVWLDADTGVTQAASQISAWLDKSDSHNDFKQADSAHQPLLVANALAGHAVVAFDAARSTSLSAPDNASLHFGVAGMTMIVVAANEKPVGHGHGGGVSTFFGKPSVAGSPSEITFHFNWFTSETTDDNAAIHLGIGEEFSGFASRESDFGDGKFRVYCASLRANAGWDMGIRVNGIALKSQDTPPVEWAHEGNFVDESMPGQPLRLGETYGQPATAGAAELVVLSGTPDLIRVAAWETYLMAKFGISQ